MVQKTTLNNGLRILTQTMPHTHSVSVLFLVGVGSRYETDSEGGAAHFIEHMVFKGTKKRPTARAIAEAIEGVGGVFGAGTGRETTVFWAKVATPHLSIALDVLVDMLRNAHFDAKELEKEAHVIVEEINLSLDSPSELVHLLAYEKLWPNHPLGRDIAGTRESVAALRRDVLLNYLARHYAPNRTVISLAGNLEREDIVARLAEHFGDWRPTKAVAFQPSPDSFIEPRLKGHFRETEQAHIHISVPGLSLSHPDRFALRLLNVVLGEGMSSRLFQEIRERLGLAYSVDAFAEMLLDTGVVGMYAGVSPSQAVNVVAALLAEWDRLRQEPVSESELHKAKEYLKGRMLLSLEDSAAYASWWGRQEVHNRPLENPDEVVARLDAVRPQVIQVLAQRLFQEQKLNLVVVGPFREWTSFLSALRF
ncbi:MAG: insulinase family protein [Anaerolineae bacterium]|nr:MAG: insulinase family protein [Anaerolineae bacterium]